MSVRIYELAKELGLHSKKVVDVAQALGLPVKSHMSSLDEGQVEQVKQALSPGAPGAKRKIVVRSTASGTKTTRITKPLKKTPTKAPAKKAAPKAAKPAPAKKPAKKAVPPPPQPKKEEKPPGKPEEPKAEPPVVVEPERKEPVPPSERPLTPRKTTPRRGAKIIYRPGDAGEAPPLAASKKSRPTPQPLARIRIDEEEDQRGIKFRGKPGRHRDETKVPSLDDLEDVPVKPRRAPFRRRPKPSAPVRQKLVPKKITEAELVSPVSIKDLSSALGVRANVIIGKLMQNGIMANINQSLEDDVVMLMAEELGIKVTLKQPRDMTEELLSRHEEADKPEDLVLRAPVVTFLGHVDHGKTSLLDAIRKANVVATESGGITQHIGAYKVTTPDGKSVVFLDTPGHEAFTEMRARGANVTDVAVLVIAADDGVMPQTEEAINHAKAAGVPIVVALNKCDLPAANPNRVKQQLTGLDLLWDKWGGSTVIVECSAVTKQGLDELVEMLSLEAELLELKANPGRQAEGVVLEANRSEGLGNTATVLVQNGALHVGDIVLCGVAYGRVRAIYDDKGQEIAEARPSTPVRITGLSEVPDAGARLYVVDDLSQAKSVAEERDRMQRQEALHRRTGIKLEEFFEYMKASRIAELRVVLKADVKGSLEVLRKTVEDLSTPEVKVRVLHAAVGGINESDVLLAHASEAIIIGFHVAPEEAARHLAEDKGVDIRLYQVIYKVGDEVKKALEGLLAPEEKEIVDGHVEVRETFKVSRLGTIAGCFVSDGTVRRNSRLRIVRDGAVIYEGTIGTLKRFKDDVREVRQGFECGIKIAGYDDIKVGDQFEFFHIEEVARTL